MKDFAGLCLFLYAFNLIFINSKSIEGIVLFTTILIFFTIKYTRLNYALENCSKIKRLNINKQHEFFIDTIIHDFRIPTLAQKQGLDLLLNGFLGELNQNQKDLILQIQSSCKYVLDMISMFSNVYMFEKNTYKLVYEKFNMSELIVSCFNELSSAAQEKNVTFVYKNSQEDSYIEADKNEIKKVILNLLTNAINYSKNGGRIDVNLDCAENLLKLCVSGMGLGYGNDKNFENNKYTTIGHTLGMYLCKKIIEIHNGKILLTENKNPQNSFTFVIPKFATKI